MHVNHDIPSGKVDRCQICGSDRLELVIDLGHQPLCDSLPSLSALDEAETTYPLRQVWCRDCTLSQIDHVVPGEVVYHPQYPYRSGITKELATYQDSLAAEVVQDTGLSPGDFVVDVGSNDGTLLSGFKKRGMRVLGIEPTDIASIARGLGIDTQQTFFDLAAAKLIVETHGRPKVVTATNVFAHMASLGAFLRGVEHLLAPDGVFVLENHYLLEVIRAGQFDTIYHEHLRTYSLRSLIKLFSYYDLTPIAAQQVSRYGGNIRVYVAKGKGRHVTASISALLKAESEFGLDRPETYARFAARAEKAKLDLLRLALDCREKGASFVGNSSPGRCSTLLNYVGIDRNLMPYIAEQPTSLKLGRYLPGKHIPIVDNERLIREQPDYVVLLAWHYAEPIAKQLRDRGLRSKFVVPLPEIQIL
jgi:SAM-dependent methyltransferase